MSYQSRVKKRRYKRVAAKAKQSRSDETAKRWFLTFARKDGRCAVCRDPLPAKSEIVYRHEPREVRCVRCASRLEDSKEFRLSIRWERAKRADRSRAIEQTAG